MTEEVAQNQAELDSREAPLVDVGLRFMRGLGLRTVDKLYPLQA
jgi:hypothetical protein